MGYSNWLAASYGTTIKVSQLVWATKQNRIEMNEEYKNGLKEPPTKIIIDNYLIETIAYNLNYISLFLVLNVKIFFFIKLYLNF